jgi:DNA-binding response OmpR family regulator
MLPPYLAKKSVGMNDYIAKPVDERLLYSKIVGIVRNHQEDQKKVKTVWIKFKTY